MRNRSDPRTVKNLGLSPLATDGRARACDWTEGKAAMIQVQYFQNDNDVDVYYSIDTREADGLHGKTKLGTLPSS
jgi:hypothetical protein